MSQAFGQRLKTGRERLVMKWHTWSLKWPLIVGTIGLILEERYVGLLTGVLLPFIPRAFLWFAGLTVGKAAAGLLIAFALWLLILVTAAYLETRPKALSKLEPTESNTAAAA